jgi:hypothetical protein
MGGRACSLPCWLTLARVSSQHRCIIVQPSRKSTHGRDRTICVYPGIAAFGGPVRVGQSPLHGHQAAPSTTAHGSGRALPGAMRLQEQK